MAGAICVRGFLIHKEVRIVNTSVKDDHLRVLWGEIGRFVQQARVPLDVRQGGPLIVNHRDIRKVMGGKMCTISYLRGMVSERGEGLAGHHAAWALGVIDEASGVDQQAYEAMQGWLKRLLVFGNPLPVAPEHFFRKACREGDLLAR